MVTWKVIPWFSNYMASSKWEVKSLNYHREWYEKILSPRIDKRKNRWYLYVSLRENWKTYTKRIHSLVMLTFVWERWEKMVINHKNWIKTDNCIENLEYCTQSENEIHSYKVLWKKPNKTNLWKFWEMSSHFKKVWQYTLDNTIINIFMGQREASRNTWVSANDICSCCRWRQKTAKWFRWKYE